MQVINKKTFYMIVLTDVTMFFRKTPNGQAKILSTLRNTHKIYKAQGMNKEAVEIDMMITYIQLERIGIDPVQ